MSLLLSAYLNKSRVPQLAAWQAAIDQLGFDCKLDRSYTPFLSSGFLPCQLIGMATGFEIYFESPVDTLNIQPHLTNIIGTRDTEIILQWGGSMAECACALIVSAALAKEFDAIAYYQDDDLLYSTKQLVEEAAAAFKDFQKS